jgi:hypothetical protein
VFSFSAHPATITVTQGIQDAFRYLGLTWTKWLPVVVIVALFASLAGALIGPVTTSGIIYTDRFDGQIYWTANAGDRLGRYSEFTLLSSIASTVGSWVFLGLAIGGLRQRQMPVSRMLIRGLWSVVASILIGAVFFVAVFVLIFLTVGLRGIGLLFLFAAIPAGIYFLIRVVFTNLAVFDGFGPLAGIQESWRLSQGSVLRLFGWGLLAFLMSFCFGFVGGIVSLPFSGTNSQALSQGISGGFAAFASCFTTFMLAALYESQRARSDPNLYGPVPTFAYGFGYPQVPPAYGYPAQPPAGYGYPPQPPAGYGYPPQAPTGQGYPPQPPAGQGWTGPSAPPAGYGWVNPNPQPPAFNYPVQSQPGSGWVVPGAPPTAPAYPPAPQGWVAPPQAGPAPQTPPAQPGAAPAEPPAPTDPPAS